MKIIFPIIKTIDLKDLGMGLYVNVIFSVKSYSY